MKSPSPFDYSLFEALYKKNINKFERSQYKVVGGKVYKTKAKEVDIDFWDLFIKNEIENHSIDVGDPIANDFLKKEFYSTGIFTKKMEAFCRFMDSNKENKDVIDLVLGIVDSKFNNYYSLFGTERCKALKFRESALEDRLNMIANSDRLKEEIVKSFSVGERYTRKFIKERLKEIYGSLSIKTKSPKANDLEEWFILNPVKVPVGEGRKIMVLRSWE